MERIRLSEPEEHHPIGSSLGYLVEYYKNSSDRRPTLTFESSGREIDGHYVLTTLISEFILTSVGVNVSSGIEVFGVSHTAEEADKRLYEKAKSFAESRAKRFGIFDLENGTRYYQSLPKGGK